VSEDPERPTPVDVGAGRVEAFSDAVMAVIITILALELRAPLGPNPKDVYDQLPSLFIYVLSFVFIAIYWNNHHHLLRATTRISGAVMWANMLLLFCLSLIPVVTEWLRSFYREPLPAASFGIVALAAAFSYSALVRAIIRANGRDSLVGTAISSDLKGNVSLVIYAGGVGLAFVDVWIAYVLYAAVAVVWLIPDRRFTRGAGRR
jgi:TMEM175 potassium channel family protein